MALDRIHLARTIRGVPLRRRPIPLFPRTQKREASPVSGAVRQRAATRGIVRAARVASDASELRREHCCRDPPRLLALAKHPFTAATGCPVARSPVQPGTAVPT